MARVRQGRRRILILTFADFQILDLTGPSEVFATATRLLQQKSGKGGVGYEVEIAAADAGPVRANSGLELGPVRAIADRRPWPDTIIVTGGSGVREALKDASLVRWLRRAHPRVRRLASVCTGALLLAEAGLLEGRRATTHWAHLEQLSRRYPGVRIEPDAIFVRDGTVYTSAGVTAGMDLALALVEEDHGRTLALEVARWLVLFLKRPGGQSQFSAQLAAQLAARDGLREVQSFALENPDADLRVERLAARASMSPRNFARAFAREVGETPARFVERVRVDAARRALEDSGDGVEGVANRCGFGSAETLRRAFIRSIGVSPARYRERFRSALAREK